MKEIGVATRSSSRSHEVSCWMRQPIRTTLHRRNVANDPCGPVNAPNGPSRPSAIHVGVGFDRGLIDCVQCRQLRFRGFIENTARIHTGEDKQSRRSGSEFIYFVIAFQIGQIGRKLRALIALRSGRAPLKSCLLTAAFLLIKTDRNLPTHIRQIHYSHWIRNNDICSWS
jgi:hypothetical protein